MPDKAKEIIDQMVRFGVAPGHAAPQAFGQTHSEMPLDFSPYGAFTPITVHSYSIANDADMERDRL